MKAIDEYKAYKGIMFDTNFGTASALDSVLFAQALAAVIARAAFINAKALADENKEIADSNGYESLRYTAAATDAALNALQSHLGIAAFEAICDRMVGAKLLEQIKKLPITAYGRGEMLEETDAKVIALTDYR